MIPVRYGSAFVGFWKPRKEATSRSKRLRTAPTALKFMEKTPADRLPDIILLDRNMPRMSGDACIRILKSDPVWKTIPVIFLTAQADKTELVKGLTLLGGDDYLAKPFDAGEMIARVKALVRAKKAEDQSRALTHNLERALEAQRKAYEELKTTKINLAETQAVAMMTRVFEKFVPKQFLQRIALDGLEALKPGNVLASRITILFSDLRSFTTISEGMTAKDLFALLNEYLAQMQGPIDHFGGFVDKFIGDAIMALFDQESSAQAEAAVSAAIGMQRQLVEWNHNRQGPPSFPITSGIGIHTGMVMLGTLGSTTRMDSTVIGDAVNLASRLEGLTKQYGVRIIVSGDTLTLLDRSGFEVRELDLVSVKGRAAPIAIHEVFLDLEGEALNRARRLAEAFAPALASYRRREWADAIAGFLACLELVPGDVAAARAPQAQRPFPKQSSNGRLGWVVHHGSQVTGISDDKAVQAVFLEEASEILKEIERDLLDLETSPDNRTLVDGLFRHLHTLKGSAGVAGMDELAHYTHAVESMLDEVRNGRIAMSSVLASLLLEALDCLKGFIAEASGDGPLDRHIVAESHRKILASMGKALPAASPLPHLQLLKIQPFPSQLSPPRRTHSSSRFLPGRISSPDPRNLRWSADHWQSLAS